MLNLNILSTSLKLISILHLQDGEVNEVSTKDNLKLKGKLEPSKLEIQMKAIAEEAKKMRLGKGK